MESLEGFVGAYAAQNHVRKADLAEAMGCSLITFNRKLSGESAMTVKEAQKLASVTGTSIDRICELVCAPSVS
jgi:plasmid maintenance system antidote protein VapI